MAREVRVFSLLTLEREHSPYVGPLMSWLAEKGWRSEICGVAYEFQRRVTECFGLGGVIIQTDLLLSRR